MEGGVGVRGSYFVSLGDLTWYINQGNSASRLLGLKLCTTVLS